jgi:hypothetical protein
MRLVSGRVVKNGVARLAGLPRPRMPPVALPPLSSVSHDKDRFSR